MSLPAAPGRIETLVKAMLRVAPGRFGMTRLVLRHVGLFAAVAVVFWGIGYALQVGFGLARLFPQRAQGILAEFLLVVVVAGFVGGLLGLFFGRAFNNPASWRMPENTAPSVAIAATWWVRWVLLGLVILLVFLVYQFFYVKSGKSSDAIDFPAVLFILLGIGTLAAVFEAVSWLVRRLRPEFIASPRLWAFACVVTWIWDVAWACGALFFVALVANKILLMLGIDAWLTPASVIAGVLFAGLLSLFDVVDVWFRRLSEIKAAPVTSRRTDYWDIDLAPETSYSGKTLKGYPFFVWRESADSRLGLSRPRHCCIVASDRELNFVFFDPSANREPTLAFLFGGGIGVAVVIATAVIGWLDGKSMSVWGTLQAIFAAAMIGTIAGAIWHLGLIVARWKFGRFAGDGRFTIKPLRLLAGFNTVHAGELGAKIDGEEAKTGHGLTAVFEDGTMAILTGNAWNYRSIVEHHAELTNTFREPRDDYLAQWEQMQKEKENEKADAPPPPPPVGDMPPAAPAAPADIPSSL